MNTNKKHKSALSEKKGVEKPVENRAAYAKPVELSIEDYRRGILSGDITVLSRAITLVESTHPKHRDKSRQLIRNLLPHSGKSIRVGITGVPGVGKSTFIEALGQYLTQSGHKVAVLAVDPTSSISKGSILGDKTRMTSLVNNPNVYIRPSSSGSTPGGVSRKTRESIILCEAAGFDIILIETVGVGQSETAVHAMTDFFLLLKLPGAGDELQGIKRGIVEMADAIVINKADGDNLHAARLAQATFGNALHLFPPKEGGWKVPVLTASALQNKNIDQVWAVVEDYVKAKSENHGIDKKRLEQERYWLYETLNSRLRDEFYNHKGIKEEMERQLSLIKEHKTTPYEAADVLLALKNSHSL